MTNGATERPERTTLMLTSEINAWLDRQRASMRAKTGTCVSRSELLRAMVRATADMLAHVPADFSMCRTEQDIGLVMFIGPAELDNSDRPAAG